MRRSATKVGVPRGLGICHNKLFAWDTYPCTACKFVPSTIAFCSKIEDFFIKLRYKIICVKLQYIVYEKDAASAMPQESRQMYFKVIPNFRFNSRPVINNPNKK